MSNRAELHFYLHENAAPNSPVGQAAANPRPQQTAQPGQAASAAAPGFSTPKPPTAVEATQQQQNAELARSVRETNAERGLRLEAERRAGDAVMAERRAAGKAKWDEFHRTGRLPGAASSAAQAAVQPPVFPGDDGPRESKPGAPPLIEPPLARRIIPTAGRVSARGVRFAALRQRAARRKAFRTAGRAAGARLGGRLGNVVGAGATGARVGAQVAGRAAAAVGGLSEGAIVGIAAAGAAIVGVGVAATAAVLGVAALGAVAVKAAADVEKFAHFSGEAAASLARNQMRQLQFDIQRSREIGPQAGQLSEMLSKLAIVGEQIYLVIEKAALGLIVPLLEKALALLEQWIQFLSDIAEKLPDFTPFIETTRKFYKDVLAILQNEQNMQGLDILGLFGNQIPQPVEWNGKKWTPQQGADVPVGEPGFGAPLPVAGV